MIAAPDAPEPAAESPAGGGQNDAVARSTPAIRDGLDERDGDLRFEIDLTDRELSSAWMHEAHARRGHLGRLLGPVLAAIGVVGLAAPEDGLSRLLSVLALAYGLFHIARPHLAARRVLAERRRRGGSTTIVVTLSDRGIEIGKDGKAVVFPWKEITAAGEREDYVWYEVRGAHRAPIPKRVIADVVRLRQVLQTRTRWMADYGTSKLGR